MDALELDMIEAEVSIHKTSFGDVSWDIFSRSIVWYKIRKAMSYIEREHFMKCWSVI